MWTFWGNCDSYMPVWWISLRDCFVSSVPMRYSRVAHAAGWTQSAYCFFSGRTNGEAGLIQSTSVSSWRSGHGSVTISLKPWKVKHNRFTHAFVVSWHQRNNICIHLHPSWQSPGFQTCLGISSPQLSLHGHWAKLNDYVSLTSGAIYRISRINIQYTSHDITCNSNACLTCHTHWCHFKSYALTGNIKISCVGSYTHAHTQSYKMHPFNKWITARLFLAPSRLFFFVGSKHR